MSVDSLYFKMQHQLFTCIRHVCPYPCVTSCSFGSRSGSESLPIVVVACQPHRRSPSIMMLLRLSFSTVSAGRRVLCSLQELQALHGKGLKFPISSPALKQATQTSDVKTTAKPRRHRDLRPTGFVFFNEKTQQPRAFINRSGS